MKKLLDHHMLRAPLLAVGGALLMAGLTLGFSRKEKATDAKPTLTAVRLAVDDKPLDRAGKFGTSFAPVVKKVSPSVVKVLTSVKTRNVSLPESPAFEDFPFRWFFGPGPEGKGARPPLHRQEGIGSGVIVTKDGYILTNNHVVDGAEEVKVVLADGREFTGKVIGKDPKTDVAVLKINGQNLPFLEMTDSDQLEIGDLVLAVGNPFGIGQTVTMGMVSAKGRGNMGLDYEDFIQTDAAINPGNSGGALVDTEGRLVGINTAILSRSGGNQGIGFAIPANLARYVMESLTKDGRVSRGYLGVLIQDVTPALASKFQLKEHSGVLIGEVTPNSPAEKAGLQNGDVVLAFQGKAVRDSRQLKLMVAQAKPGEKVPVKIQREGASKTIEVTLKELPGTEPLAKAEAGKAADTGTLEGVAVEDLDNRTRRQLDVPERLRGALITEVAPESAAQEAGLQPGDVILEINRQPVNNAADAVRLTEQPKDKKTLLRVWRKGHSRYLVVDESKAG